MSGHANRNRVTVYPLDAWAKRLSSTHEPWADDCLVWWFDPQFWTVPMPTGWGHIGYAEVGSSDHASYDRGALMRHRATGKYGLWTRRSMRNLDQRKVDAALRNGVSETEQTT